MYSTNFFFLCYILLSASSLFISCYFPSFLQLSTWLGSLYCKKSLLVPGPFAWVLVPVPYWRLVFLPCLALPSLPFESLILSRCSKVLLLSLRVCIYPSANRPARFYSSPSSSSSHHQRLVHTLSPLSLSLRKNFSSQPSRRVTYGA